MTPAEIVAVKLLGWSLRPDAGGQKCYEHLSGSVHFVGGELDGCGMGPVGGEDFPDFTDNYAAWYWIRRVEDALAEKGLYGKYLLALLEQPSPVEFAYEWAKQGMDRETYGVWHTNRATVAQAIQAAIRVIEEAGL